MCVQVKSQLPGVLLRRCTSCCCHGLTRARLCVSPLSADAHLSLRRTRLDGSHLAHTRQHRNQQPPQLHQHQQQQQPQQPLQAPPQHQQQQHQEQYQRQQQQQRFRLEPLQEQRGVHQQRDVEQHRQPQRLSASSWPGCCCSSLDGHTLSLCSGRDRQQLLRAKSVCIWKLELLHQHQRRSFFWDVPASVAAALLPAVPAVLNVNADPGSSSSSSNSSSNSSSSSDGGRSSRSPGRSSPASSRTTRWSSSRSHEVTQCRQETGSESSTCGKANNGYRDRRCGKRESSNSSSSASLPFTTLFRDPVRGERTTDEQLLRHTEHRVVGVAAEKYFAVVRDVDKYHEFLPWIKESRVLRPEECSSGALLLQQHQQAEEGDGETEVFAAELVIGFSFLCDRYTSVVCVKRPSPRAVTAHQVQLLASCSSPTSAGSPRAAADAADDFFAAADDLPLSVASPSTPCLPQQQQQHLLDHRQGQQNPQQRWELDQQEQRQNGRPTDGQADNTAAAAPFEISVCAADSKVFKTLETRWSFWPRGCSTAHATPSQQPQQTCYVAFSIAFEFRSVLHQSFASAFLRDVAAAVGRCFDTRVFQLAASPHPSLPSSSFASSTPLLFSLSSSPSLTSSKYPLSASSSPLFSRRPAAFQQPPDEAAAAAAARATPAAPAALATAAGGGGGAVARKAVAASTAATAALATAAGGGAAIARKPATPSALNSTGAAAAATGTAALEEKTATPAASGATSPRRISATVAGEVTGNSVRTAVADARIAPQIATAGQPKAAEATAAEATAAEATAAEATAAETTAAEAVAALHRAAAPAPKCPSEGDGRLPANAVAPGASAADAAAAEAAQESAIALLRRAARRQPAASSRSGRTPDGTRGWDADSRSLFQIDKAAITDVEDSCSERLGSRQQQRPEQEQTREQGLRGSADALQEGGQGKAQNEIQLAVQEQRHRELQQQPQRGEEQQRWREGEPNVQLLQRQRQGSRQEKTQQNDIEEQQEQAWTREDWSKEETQAADSKQTKGKLLLQHLGAAVEQAATTADSSSSTPHREENLYPDKAALEDRTAASDPGRHNAAAAAPLHPLILSKKIVLCADDPPPLDVAKLLLRLSQLQKKPAQQLRHSGVRPQQLCAPEQEAPVQDIPRDTRHRQQHIQQMLRQEHEEAQQRQRLEQGQPVQSYGSVVQQQQRSNTGNREKELQEQQQRSARRQRHYYPSREKGREAGRQAAPAGVCRSSRSYFDNCQVEGGQRQHEGIGDEENERVQVFRYCRDVPRLSAAEAQQLRCFLLSGDKKKIASLVAVFLACDPQQRWHWTGGRDWTPRTDSSSRADCSSNSTNTNTRNAFGSLCSRGSSCSRRSKWASISGRCSSTDTSVVRKENISQDTTENEICSTCTSSGTDYDDCVAGSSTSSVKFTSVGNVNGVAIDSRSSDISSSVCSYTTKDTEKSCGDSSSRVRSCGRKENAKLGKGGAGTAACSEFVSFREEAAKEVTAQVDPAQALSDGTESSLAEDTGEHELLLVLRELLLCSSSNSSTGSTSTA